MQNYLSICGILACLLTAGTPALSQSNQAQLQVEAEDALVGGEPARTAALAQQMLATNTDSFTALLLLALAQSDLGDQQQAAATAADAYRAAPTEEARLQAARLVASIRFGSAQYARSEFWLRRAANHTQTDQESQDVVREYIRAARANPLSLEFSASVAPSDNINDGSNDGILRFEGIDLDFVLPEDQRALSGIEFSGSARVNYRLTRNPNQTTTLNGYVSGRTYALSSSAKDLLASSPNATVRSVKGSDFATVVAEIGITHRRPQLVSFGPTAFTVTFGTYWQGGDRLVYYQDIVLEQTIPLRSNAAFSFRGSIRDQQALEPSVVDSVIYDAVGAYSFGLPNNDRLKFSLAWRQNDAGLESTYTEYRTGVRYTFAKSVWTTRWSTSLDLEYRDYDEFATTLDGRQDRVIRVGADAVFEGITYFGFSPTMSFDASRRVSNAEEITSSAAQVQIGVESSF